MRNVCPLLALLCLASSAASEPERVDLTPIDAPFGMREVGAAVSALFGGGSYWYEPRTILLETVPADAEVRLYYLRRNFQRSYVTSHTPLHVGLPARVKTTANDTIRVRVFAPGYRTLDRSFRAREMPDEVLLKLDGLPNALTKLVHSHIGGRSTLVLHTTEDPHISVSRNERRPGFDIVLGYTASRVESATAVRGGHVVRALLEPYGEDLLLGLETRRSDLQLRSRRRFEPVDRVHVVVLDLVPPDAPTPSMETISDEISAAQAAVGACDAGFESVLSAALDPAALQLAFQPTGSLVDAYRRQAMVQLGRSAQGRVRRRSGDELRTGDPFDLQLALEAPADIEGYFGLVGAVARAQDDPEAALRSLLDGAVPPGAFGDLYRSAEQARERCLD